MSEQQDWRLEAELDVEDTHQRLEALMRRVRGARDDALTADVKAVVSHDVVVSHDGRLLFAYANTEDALQNARRAIETLLDADGVGARMSVSAWDGEIDDWRQVDPRPAGEQLDREQGERRDAETLETRTLVAGAGNLIRDSFERTMRDYAERLGLECDIAEQHPHLLRTQVAFTVHGPKRKVDEFALGLRAQGWATVRAESNVLNPL